MLTRVPGIKVGHASDREAVTGCTVVLCPPGTVGGVDVRGGAPGTRETDLLRPMNLVQEVHAVLLAGGSAFGLAAADGVVRYLEENGIGYDTGVARVPIVPAAVIFDLDLGSFAVRPTPEMGYEAAAAATDQPGPTGNVGAGTGATVGRILGPEARMKGGLGTAAVELPGGCVVAALAVVNAFGDVIGEDGRVVAGALGPDGEAAGTADIVMQGPPQGGSPAGNTTLVVVATDAKLTKAEVNRVALEAHDGMARAIKPVHTIFDGDAVFALATGRVDVPPVGIGTAAAQAVTEAIRSGVRAAKTVAGVRGLAAD